MILDKQNLFSDDQAVTASAASTNVIDLGDNASEIQELIEKNAEIFCQVTVDFATLTSLKVTVQTDDDEAFGSPTTVLETAAIAAASLVAGYKFNVGRILPLITEQYVRLYFTVAGSDATAGKIAAGLIVNTQTAK